MTRLAWVTLVAWALGGAPIQCARDPDPNLRREDTAGDALWALAQQLKAEKNDAAARRTLEYLVERYPSSRHAEAAREEIARLPAAGTGACPTSPPSSTVPVAPP